MKKVLVGMLLFVLVLVTDSCYRDKFNEMYPAVALVDGCDTTRALTYSATVSVIMGTNCVSCHSGRSAAGGIKLDNYSGVVAMANNGKLMGSIKHQSSYKPMPVNSSLRTCEIARLDEWIAKGMPQ